MTTCETTYRFQPRGARGPDLVKLDAFVREAAARCGMAVVEISHRQVRARRSGVKAIKAVEPSPVRLSLASGAVSRTPLFAVRIRRRATTYHQTLAAALDALRAKGSSLVVDPLWRLHCPSSESLWAGATLGVSIDAKIAAKVVCLGVLPPTPDAKFDLIALPERARRFLRTTATTATAIAQMAPGKARDELATVLRSIVSRPETEVSEPRRRDVVGQTGAAG